MLLERSGDLTHVPAYIMLEKSGDLTHTLETIILMMLAETGCTCNILCRQQHVIIRDMNMKVSIDGSNSLA